MRTIDPDPVELGQTVQVTLRVQAVCPEQSTPFHLVLVVDDSGSMAGPRSQEVRAALLTLLDGLDLPNQPSTRVGVVAFNDTARTLCPLSGADSENPIEACIQRLSGSGGSSIERGLLEGLSVMRQGRSLAGGPVIYEVMLLITDGADDAGCSAASAAARAVKSQGVLLLSVCMGDACDRACVRTLASSALYFEPDLEVTGLVDRVLALQAEAGRTLSFQSFALLDRLPPNMRYVEGSAQPPASWDAASRTLSWRRSLLLPATGVTHTFRIEPLELGRHPTSLEARVDYAHAGDGGRLLRGSAAFPIDEVTVLAGAPTPTPNPLPGLVARLEVEPATLGLGERARARYSLDFELPEPPGETHLALVLDESGSMMGESMERLQEGVGRMLDRLEAVVGDEGSDFAASVVSFKSSAKVLCPLTDSFPMLRACVSRLSTAGGTGIDEGLRLGLTTLQEGRPWSAGEDLVLFSDGSNNQGCAPVLEAADRIKAEDIVLHSVCLGEACDEVCLRDAASSPRHFFKVDQAGDLPIALGSIAEDLLARRGVESVALELGLPAHLEPLPGSFSIAPERLDDEGASWSLPRLPAGGLQLDFEVVAVAEGREPMTMSASLERLGADPLSDERRSPEVSVPGAPTEPTPTATEPGPGETPTEPVPPRDTATPGPIFLPLLLGEACPGWPKDLVLVVDGSLSMGERFGAEGSKLEVARRGLRDLLASLGAGDRVALVSFDAEARLLEPFTADPARLGAALERIELARGTAIDAGIDRAVAALLASERRDLAEGVIVLVSNGRALEASPDAAIAAAERARGYKLEVHAIGLGREVDEPTLRAVAGSAGRYRRAESAPVALRALAGLGVELRCPSGSIWGRR